MRKSPIRVKSSTAKSFINNPIHKNKVLKAKASIEIANAVSGMRRKSGLTKKELAKELGIKKCEYEQIENGKNVSIYRLIQMAEICGAKLNLQVIFPKYQEVKPFE